MNKNIFRAYDIRGIHPQDINMETMRHIGHACAQYVRTKYGAKNMVIGRDGRLSGAELQEAFISGALETGIEIINVGMATSPMVYWAGCFYGYDGGAVITASHNPKEYNGVKLFGPRAHSICGEELQKIYKTTQAGHFHRGEKTVGKQRNLSIFQEYKNDLVSKVTAGGNFKSEKLLKIVIDAGNGISGPFAPALLRAAGHEVIELYTEVDGNFPNHIANPEQEENLRDLKKAVKKHKADIGIGFDGDGDRIGIIDEKGTFYSADYLLVLFARDLLTRHRGVKIIFDIKTSKMVENEIKRLGGIPIRHKTGHSFTETKMREENALLAGECSGHMFFGENYYGFDDAMFAALKVCKILVESEKPLSEHFNDLPKLYTTPEIKVPCEDNAKFHVIEELVKEFQRDRAHGAAPQIKNIITIDGAFVEFSDTDWGAVRASNTTPCLTLRFEAQTREKLEQIQKLFQEKMSARPEIDTRITKQ